MGMMQPTDPSDRIVRRKLSDQVFDRLRDMIASGELTPGAPLPSERDLMERFGTGRPAVREALQHLHTMGLITISHGERSRVNALSADSVLSRVDDVARMLLSSEPDQLDHLKQARRMFECGLVRMAAQTATEADVADLRDLIAAQRDCLGDAARFVTQDMAFHARIAAISAIRSWSPPASRCCAGCSVSRRAAALVGQRAGHPARARGHHRPDRRA